MGSEGFNSIPLSYSPIPGGRSSCPLSMRQLPAPPLQPDAAHRIPQAATGLSGLVRFPTVWEVGPNPTNQTYGGLETPLVKKGSGWPRGGAGVREGARFKPNTEAVSTRLRDMGRTAPPARVVRERFGQARVMTITPDFAFSQAHDPRSPRMQYDPHQAPKLRSR